MLELLARNEQPGSPTAILCWCISRDTAAELKEEGAVLPHLLLVVTKGKGSEWTREVSRRLIPLDQVMEYVDFHSSGKHEIHAQIVWHKKGDVRTLRAVVLGGKAHGCKFGPLEILNGDDGTLRDCSEYLGENNIVIQEEASVEVEVAEGHFAKEPSAFEKWYVNLWFENPPRDQCAFRKRRLVAYTVQPIPVLLYVTLLCLCRGIVVLFFLSLAKRGVNFGPLIHPWNYDTNDIWLSNTRGTFFTHTNESKERDSCLVIILMPFTPIVGAVVFLLAAYSKFLGHEELSILWSLACALAFQIGVAMVLFALLIIIEGVGRAGSLIWWTIWRPYIRPLLKKLPEFKTVWRSTACVAIMFCLGILSLFLLQPLLLIQIALVASFLWFINYGILRITDYLTGRWMDKLKPSEIENQRALLEKDLQPLLCDGRPMKLDYKSLPAQSRSLYLWYRDTKVKVCRPFARSQFYP
jgi:hypothetical protein